MKLKPCPGCGRARSTCWIMPCLHLEVVIERGPKAVARWGKPGGMIITPKGGA